MASIVACICLGYFQYKLPINRCERTFMVLPSVVSANSEIWTLNTGLIYANVPLLPRHLKAQFLRELEMCTILKSGL